MSKVWVSTCVLIGSLFCVDDSAQATTTVLVKEQAVVEKLDVRLGDLAEITSSDPHEKMAIERVYIGRAPRVGVAGVIGQPALEAALRSQFGTQASSVKWNGAAKVKVLTASQEFDEGKIAKDTKQILLDKLIQRFGNGEVVEEILPEPVMLPKGRISVAVRPISANDALTSFVTVWADVSVDDVPYRSIAMHFRLRATELRASTSRSVGKGDAVEVDTMVMRDENVFSACERARNDASDKRFAGSFEPGHVICNRDVSAMPVVKRGEHATLRSSSGGIEIQESVVILEDAARGAEVRVVPEHGHTELVAKVVSPGVVRLSR